MILRRYVGAQIGIHNPKGEKVGEVSHLTNREYLFVAGPDAARIVTDATAMMAERRIRRSEAAFEITDICCGLRCHKLLYGSTSTSTTNTPPDPEALFRLREGTAVAERACRDGDDGVLIVSRILRRS